jgi:hypothetical protein
VYLPSSPQEVNARHAHAMSAIARTSATILLMFFIVKISCKKNIIYKNPVGQISTVLGNYRKKKIKSVQIKICTDEFPKNTKTAGPPCFALRLRAKSL